MSSPTSTKTATDAYTGRNVTVTGGAGSGATVVKISHQPDGPEQIGRSHRSADGDLLDAPMQAQFRGPANVPLQSQFRHNPTYGRFTDKASALDYAKTARTVYKGVSVSKNGLYWQVTVGPMHAKVKRQFDKTHSNPGGSEYQSAVEASEEFHGTDSSEVFTVTAEVFEHDNLSDLGELVSMEIAAVNGGIVKLHGFDGARLAQSPKGFPYQLFIEGGDQSVDLAEFGIDEPHEKEVLGKLKRIKYYTIKHHLGKDGGEANYKHKLGEIDGKLPTVIYDVMNESLEIAGGGYVVLPEGIDN